MSNVYFTHSSCLFPGKAKKLPIESLIAQIVQEVAANGDPVTESVSNARRWLGVGVNGTGLIYNMYRTTFCTIDRLDQRLAYLRDHNKGIVPRSGAGHKLMYLIHVFVVQSGALFFAVKCQQHRCPADLKKQEKVDKTTTIAVCKEIINGLIKKERQICNNKSFNV